MFAARNMMFAGAGGAFDADAADYFARIVTAGSGISAANKTAVNAFVVGCKADGIWSAIKASCILAGADTLAGALVPLVGAAPTNFNFVADDYSRTTGLNGDGVSKYLNSNRASNADPQNDISMAVWATAAEVKNGTFQGAIGRTLAVTGMFANNSTRFHRLNGNMGNQSDTLGLIGFWGMSRTSSSTCQRRLRGVTTSETSASSAGNASVIDVFALGGNFHSTARQSFYMLGESLDLALLDARLTTLMDALT